MGRDDTEQLRYQGAAGFCVEVSSNTTRSEARLRGPLDATTTPCLDAALDQIIRGGYRHVVLDLAELDFLAAAGLRVLVRADAELRATGGSLTLTNLSPSARRVLAITGLDTSLTLD